MGYPTPQLGEENRLLQIHLMQNFCKTELLIIIIQASVKPRI